MPYRKVRMMKRTSRRLTGLFVAMLVSTLLLPTAVQAPNASAASIPANQVLEWNQIFVDTLIATNTANSSSQRLGAIVHTAIFDAYNGIDRRYTPMFVQSAAPRAASRRAAANRRRAHRVGGSVPVPTISARCQLCRLARASA